jgi:hypothetical protein
MSYLARIKWTAAAAALAAAAGGMTPAPAQNLPKSPLGVIGTSTLGLRGTSAMTGRGTTSGFVNRRPGTFTPGFTGTGFAGSGFAGWGAYSWYPSWVSPWGYGVAYPDWVWTGPYLGTWSAPAVNLPLVGVNAPPLFSGRSVAGTPRAPRREESPASAARSSATSERIARRLAEVMRTQALIPGRVEAIGADRVRVRIEPDGQSVTRRYALSDVYFTRGEAILDAASAPERLKVGDTVMVPERAGTAE